MKGTLRKTSEGVIFTIDERPSFGDLFYDTYLNAFVYNRVADNANCYNQHKILASTFGLWFGLWAYTDHDQWHKPMTYEANLLEGYIDFNTEYPYTIQDNKVIIEI